MDYRLENVIGHYKSRVESHLYFSQVFYSSLARILPFMSYFQKKMIFVQLYLPI